MWIAERFRNTGHLVEDDYPKVRKIIDAGITRAKAGKLMLDE